VVVRTAYTTVARTASAEIVVKRPRFRCHVERVDIEDAAEPVDRPEWTRSLTP
jgi:hypothetical protein